MFNFFAYFAARQIVKQLTHIEDDVLKERYGYWRAVEERRITPLFPDDVNPTKPDKTPIYVSHAAANVDLPVVYIEVRRDNLGSTTVDLFTETEKQHGRIYNILEIQKQYIPGLTRFFAQYGDRKAIMKAAEAVIKGGYPEFYDCQKVIVELDHQGKPL